jgi:ADP-ribose pyrophosphatase
MHAFVATSLTPGPQHTQADEMIQVRVLPIPDALALIRRGELTDAKSILALWSAIRSGFVPGFNAGLL